jgi:hypothetical protein
LRQFLPIGIFALIEDENVSAVGLCHGVVWRCLEVRSALMLLLFLLLFSLCRLASLVEQSRN